MNSLKNIVAALVLAGTVTLPFAASAQGSSPVTLSGDVKAVETSVDAEGNETTQLVDPDVIVPGDRLVFGTDYANNGAEAVENFVVTNPPFHAEGPVCPYPEIEAYTSSANRASPTSFQPTWCGPMNLAAA